MLLLKLSLVPVFVALIALIGRCWGAKWAGLISGFPVIAGPIIYFLYLDQGLVFAQKAAIASLAGIISLSTFCFSYAFMAARFTWALSALVSLIIFFLLGMIIVKLDMGLYLSLALSFIVICTQILFSPRHDKTVSKTPASNTELIVRMIAAACLVLLVTYFAPLFGPGLSGVMAVFPIASTIIAVFSHRNHSAFHAMDSLKALKIGLLSMLVFFFVLSVSMVPIGFHLAFVLSILSALALQAVVWLFRRYLASSSSS